jgi:hypothetical protein
MENGIEFISHLADKERGHLPRIILPDLNMPKKMVARY